MRTRLQQFAIENAFTRAQDLGRGNFTIAASRRWSIGLSVNK